LIPVVLGANGLFNIAGSNEMKVDDLSGFGKSLTKTGSGVLELLGASYTGNTDLLAGTLKVWSALGSGTVTVNTGTCLQLADSSNDANWSGGILNLSGTGIGATGALRSMG